MNTFSSWAMVAALAASFGLAGCAQDVPDELQVPDARLEFDGSGSGEHEERTACDQDGRLDANGRVTDGSLLVTVTDGSGNRLFEQEFTGDVDLDGRQLSGASGDWTIHGERQGDDLVGDDFSGRYDVRLTC